MQLVCSRLQSARHTNTFIPALKMVHMSWQHAVKLLAPDKYCYVVGIIKISGHVEVLQ